ncbi:MAG: 30S ribosomal protein S30e [Crenarchaeota archaeon]|nr:30S ribosomal protein S30e [Thermoproteota archaeon]MCR8454268.1 30S ribosomal protein S30e [Thermoproteota archaeon]MCR8455036.1 30S ribosomal protein S30e [Thermoproteota archaeon]MCR8463241.1 30S ribosomal protein S30e [Thermoproteota archaeon]MCR8470484.1 30S ribosomal protein S30e [Thermoproteota archaeon]
MTHGSLDKAGKVRKATLESVRMLGITPKERHTPPPRVNRRELYWKRFIKNYRIGQPLKRE